MVILLAGATRIGRSAIANRLVQEIGEWRHLPLEDISELQQLGALESKEKDDVMLRIACKCAEELEDRGYHIVISCDYRPGILTIARDELGEIIGVHLGPQAEIERSDFPHKIDSKNTVGDVHELLLSIC